MAYNFPTATQDFGYGIGETEEERRRREEQERMQREQQAAMAAQQQAEAEAQRQREQQEAEQRAAMEAQAQQSVAEIPSGMAAPNPYGSAIAQGGTTEGPAPTQGGPVAPDQASIEEQRRLQQVQQAQPVAEMPQPVAPEQPQPVAQPQPQAVQQPAAPVAPEQPQLPQPGPGVQVAGPTQMPPAAPAAAPAMSMQERIAAAAQRAQERAGTAQPGQLPAASVGSLQQVSQQQVTPTFETRFTDAANDISKLDQLRKDETLTKEQRMLAGRQAQDLLTRELGPIKAKEEVANMSEMEIARLLKSKSEEGSWGKLLLLGFVSPTLAAKEAAKLGLNDQWSVGTTTDGTPVLLKTRDGVPIEGVNGTTGKNLSPKELISAAAQATTLKGATTHTGKMQDTTTGEVYYERTTPQGIQLVDNNGKIYRGSSANLRPFGIGSDVATKNIIQIQELRNKLAFAGPTASAAEREKVIAESEAKFGPLPESYKAAVRAGQPLPTGLSEGSPIAAPAAQPAAQPAATVQQPVAQQPGAAPAAPVAPTAPAAPAAVAKPVVPGAPAAAPITTPGVAAAGGVGPAQREANLAVSKAAAEAEIQRKKELAIAEQKPEAAARGADKATDVKNQGFADRTYDLMKPINDAIVKSTGSSIGAGVDTVAAALGKSTEGSKAIARLNVLSYGILSNIPRFEGPQSDIDVQMYKQAAGDFANRKLPVEDRLAALDALRSILQRYDKAGKNDWSFSSGGQSSAGAASGTTASGNKYKRVN